MYVTTAGRPRTTQCAAHRPALLVIAVRVAPSTPPWGLPKSGSGAQAHTGMSNPRLPLALLAAGLAAASACCGQPAYQVFAVRVASAPAAPPGLRAAAASPAAAPQRGPQQSDGKLDLNRASATRLRRLPGASSIVIAAILAGRPYTAKRQLLQRGVLSPAQYAVWKNYLVVHRTTPALVPRRARRPRSRPR
jgi:competence protein ComEA